MRITSFFWRRMVIILFLAFMIIPVIATLAFSVSIRWDRSILPEGLTLEWWRTVTERGAFRLTLKNSFLASLATALCLSILVAPSAYLAHVRLPKSKVIYPVNWRIVF